MYEILRNGLSLGITENEPTQEYLDEILCDSYREYSENPESKRNQIKQSLISSSDLSIVDLEWISFSDKEIGDIILERVFEGNPHGQSAMLAKTSAYLLSVISWNANEDILANILAKQSEINEVRAKFNLQSL